MDDVLIRHLESIVVGAVAITARAIAESGADLTFAQWRVVLVVGERPDGVTISDVATRLGAHQSPASRLVSRLRHRGVVQSHRDARDARVVWVTLTDSGRDLRSRVLERRRHALADILTGASPGPGDKPVLADLARAFLAVA